MKKNRALPAGRGGMIHLFDQIPVKEMQEGIAP